MALDDTFAFADHDPLITVHACYSFHFALGPTDRQVRLRGAAHAEVHPKISLRDMKPAAADFIDLVSPAGN
jgi:hypothetical protein